MQFRLLGPMAVEVDGAALPLGSGRERLVLAVLLLAADRLTSADHLIDAVWESPPPTARQQLQNLIAGLRRRFGAHDPGLVLTRPFGYELRLGEHSLDVSEFRRLVLEAETALGRGGFEPARRHLETALGLWRGDVLADVDETVLADTRRALDEERRAALDALLDLLHRLGRPDDVLARVTGPLSADPWNERLHAHRIRALASTGRRSEAIEAYLSLRRTLIDELGVAPSRLLVELNDQVVQGLDDLRGHAPAPRRVPRELPPPTWQLFGRDELVTDVVEVVRHGGGGAAQARRGAAEAVGGAAESTGGGTAGPVTVVLAGGGGVGKSAVAVTVGHLLSEDHPDGTLWIPLGEKAFADPIDAVGRALRSLGIAPTDVPADLAARTALYRSTLADRQVLVVVDGAVSEAQVRPLLPATPGSAALITSRRKLTGIVGATRRTLAPLDPAASAELLGALAGPSRVRDEPEELELIGTLCGQLPLALCVVGARLAANEHLGLGDLRARLGRERTRLDELSAGDIDVRASIMTSVDGLGVRARTLFGRFSVGSVRDWPAWVAEELSGEATWLRDLDELIDLHLVEPTGRDEVGQPRFRMLGPMGELASELHAEALASDPGAVPDDVLRRRLLAGWERLAGIADDALESTGRTRLAPPESVRSAPGSRRPGEPGLEDAEHAERAERVEGAPDSRGVPAATAPREWFEIERPHLVAMITSVPRSSGEAGTDVAGAELAINLTLHITSFLRTRAYDDDRERVLRHALDLLPEGADADLEVRLLHALFAVLAQRRALSELPAVASRQLAAARRSPGRAGETGALTQAGWAAASLDRFAEAADWFAQAARLAEDHDDSHALAAARGQMGVVLRNAGRADEADALFARMVDDARANGTARITCIWLVTRAEGLVDLRRYAEADALLTEAQSIAEGLGDDLGVAHCRLARASLLVGRGDDVGAADQLEPALEVLDRHAPGGADPECRRVRADIEALAGEGDAARTHLLQAIAIRRSRGARIELARDLARLARLLPAGDDVPGAAGGETGGWMGAQSRAEMTAEVNGILALLGLDHRALRLPPDAFDLRSG